MGNVEVKFKSEKIWGGTSPLFAVKDYSGKTPRVICQTSTEKDAKFIADALNASSGTQTNWLVEAMKG